MSYRADLKPFTAGKPAGDGHLLNVAFVHTGSTPPPFPEECLAENTPACASTENLTAALRVQKISDPIRETPVRPGETISYTLEFANGGTATVPIDGTDWMHGALDDATLVPGSLVVDPAGALDAHMDTDAQSLRVTGELPGNQRVSIKYELLVGEAGTGDGVLRNFLVRTGEDPESRCDDGNLLCTVHFVPGLQIEKRFDAGTGWVDRDGSGTISIGDLLSYDFTVTNTGQAELSELQVQDEMLADAGISIRCTPNNLAPGESVHCEQSIAYTVTAADASTGEVVNVASATARHPQLATGLLAESEVIVVPIEQVQSQLSLTKTLNKSEVATGIDDVNANGLTDSGDLVWYAFTLSNEGETIIANPKVSDPMLEAAGVNVECAAEELAPGEQLTCLATAGYKITDDDATQKRVLNTATASGTASTGTVNATEVSLSVPVVVQAPGLELTKVLNEEQGVGGIEDLDETLTNSPGDLVWYAFDVHNSGNVTVADVAVIDGMLANAGINVSCAAQKLAPGETTHCVSDAGYTLSAADAANGKLSSSAAATGVDPGGTDVTSPNAILEIPAVPATAGLEIVKRLDDSVANGGVSDENGNGLIDEGDLLWYAFTVKNFGEIPLRDVNVVDSKLPAPDFSVACDVTVLAPGESTECRASGGVRITAEEAVAGVATNTAHAAAATPVGTPVRSEPDLIDVPTALAEPSLFIQKKMLSWEDADHSMSHSAGDRFLYGFTVWNDGNIPVVDVRVEDELLGAEGIDTTCTPTDLDPGEHSVCVADEPYLVTVADASNGKVVNTAVAVGQPVGETGELASAPDTLVTPVHPVAPNIALIKNLAPSPGVHGIEDVNGDGLVNEGDLLWYSFQVVNHGDVPLTAAQLSDEMLENSGVAATCEIDDPLEPHRVGTCLADEGYRISRADQDSGKVKNVATVSAASLAGQQVESAPAEHTIRVTVARPGIALEKVLERIDDADASGTVNESDALWYGFTVTNIGNVPLFGPEISDPLLDSAGIDVTCPAGGIVPGKRIVCTPAEGLVITGEHVLDGEVVNIATAFATPAGLEQMESDPSEVHTHVFADPKLVLTKDVERIDDRDHSGTNTVGDLIWWEFSVANAGNVPISSLAIDDALLDSVGIAVSCTVTELAPGASTACRAEAGYEVTKADRDAERVKNSAFANGVNPAGTAPVVSNLAETTSGIAPGPIKPEPPTPEGPSVPSKPAPGAGGELEATGANDAPALLLAALAGLMLLGGSGIVLLRRRAQRVSN